MCLSRIEILPGKNMRLVTETHCAQCYQDLTGWPGNRTPNRETGTAGTEPRKNPTAQDKILNGMLFLLPKTPEGATTMRAWSHAFVWRGLPPAWPLYPKQHLQDSALTSLGFCRYAGCRR